MGVWLGIVSRRCAWKPIFLVSAFQNMAFMFFVNCVTVLKGFLKKKSPEKLKFCKHSVRAVRNPKFRENTVFAGFTESSRVR